MRDNLKIICINRNFLQVNGGFTYAIWRDVEGKEYIEIWNRKGYVDRDNLIVVV